MSTLSAGHLAPSESCTVPHTQARPFFSFLLRQPWCTCRYTLCGPSSLLACWEWLARLEGLYCTLSGCRGLDNSIASLRNFISLWTSYNPPIPPEASAPLCWLGCFFAGESSSVHCMCVSLLVCSSPCQCPLHLEVRGGSDPISILRICVRCDLECVLHSAPPRSLGYVHVFSGVPLSTCWNVWWYPQRCSGGGGGVESRI
jgi:hypothetical protein